MSKVILIIALLLIAIIAFYVYLSNQPPPGIETKGNEATIALISLIAGIISLLGSIMTFILKIIEIRAARQNK